MAHVQFETDGAVGVIIIDNPPINATSTEVRRGLIDAIAEITATPALTGGVIIGAGSIFIGGAELREFGQKLAPPELPEVIAAIEACPKPIVAAIAGAALGGGYEIALACDRRIATQTATLGLPEVSLGIIPGAGGTQRLPRLVGIATAIELICTAARISATRALTLGMIDAIATGNLRMQAVALAHGAKHQLSKSSVPADPPGAIDAAIAKAMRAGKSRPPTVAAIAAIRAAADQKLSDGLALERRLFTELRDAPEAAALRHLFFAERAAARGPKSAPPRAITNVGVIGAGTMGAGIAAALLESGLPVVLVDAAPAALAAGSAKITTILARWRDSERIDPETHDDLTRRFSTTSDLAALAHCDAVIEAIVERMDAKAALLAALGDIVSPAALIASNTSYLDLNQLAACAPNPARVLGLHFFNPAQIMRLIEVVRATTTDDTTLATGLALARRLGKQAVVANAGPGFIGNRIYSAYRSQCEFMLEEGALPEQIDQALESFGFALGPFATGDLSGLDIAWAMRRATGASRNPSHRYSDLPDLLCESGRLGRKTHGGWYAYPEGAKRGVPDPAVTALIKTHSAERSFTRRDFTPEEIVWRVLITMVNEAALLLTEGVARHPADIDVVFVNGFGFPRHEGGPLFWGARQDRSALHAARDALEQATGAGFCRGDIDAVLDNALQPI
jgi:3-hydroxyacyl-CoA dehydrogenase